MNALVKLQDNANGKVELTISSTPETMISRFFAFLDTSEQTVRTYRYGISQFMKYLHAENINRPTRENVIAFKKALIAKGLKPSTIALYLSAIRRFFSWSASEGLYPNITDGVKSPKQQGGHKRDYLSGSQIQAMLKSTTSKRDYAMIALIACTGLRTIEIVRANVEDIRTLGASTVLYVCGKGRTDKTEFVNLSEPVLKALQESLSERGNPKGNEPLFVSESRRNSGKRLTTRTVSGVCKNAMKKAGYNSNRLTAHSLRHSAATLALLGGASLEDVQQFMRHSSVNVTMIYVHSVQRLKSQCESCVTSAIFGERKIA
jgi:integrase/recombinase XerC